MSRFSLRNQPLAAVRLIGCIVLGLLAAHDARPQAPTRELLNSERIEQKFGSYGIAVLRSDAQLRVANLFSGAGPGGAERICRTFAVTRYPANVVPAFAAEHREILAGGSIGAVFAAHGWRVTKTHMYFGRIEASARVAGLMLVAPGAPLALDAYVLEVTKEGATFEYAAIVEIHHPDYLALADVEAIYPAPDASGREALLASVLADAAQAAR